MVGFVTAMNPGLSSSFVNYTFFRKGLVCHSTHRYQDKTFDDCFSPLTMWGSGMAARASLAELSHQPKDRDSNITLSAFMVS